MRQACLPGVALVSSFCRFRCGSKGAKGWRRVWSRLGLTSRPRSSLSLRSAARKPNGSESPGTGVVESLALGVEKTKFDVEVGSAKNAEDWLILTSSSSMYESAGEEDGGRGDWNL